MTRRLYLFVFSFALISSFVSAQITITGTVRDADTYEPLIGAYVMVSDEMGEIYAKENSDFDGNYIIEVRDSSSVLSFSFHGMISESISVRNNKKIDVALKADPDHMEEVILVGSASGMSRAQIKLKERETKKEYKGILEGNTALLILALGEEKAAQYTKLASQNYNQILLEDIDSLFSCSPTGLNRLDDLIDGSQKFVYSFQKKIKTQAKILAFFNLKYEEGKKYLISDFVQYKDVSCPSRNEKIIRYGVGIRLKIFISNIKVNYDMNIPTQVAAAAELGLCEASYMVETIGFSTKESRKIMAGLNGSFDIEEFMKITDAEKSLIESLEDDMKVQPKMIPINEIKIN